MIYWLRPGQQVVCIVQPPTRMHPEILPQLGQVYTVREVVICRTSGHPCLRFNEIRNQPMQYIDGFMECSWAYYWFRPAVERPTDISVFKELLNDPHREIERTKVDA